MLPDCCGCFLPFHFRINLHEISAVFKSRVEVFHSSAGSARNLKSELSQISGCLRIKTTIFRLCRALINFQLTEHPIRCGLDVPPIPPDSLCRFFFPFTFLLCSLRRVRQMACGVGAFLDRVAALTEAARSVRCAFNGGAASDAGRMCRVEFRSVAAPSCRACCAPTASTV